MLPRARALVIRHQRQHPNRLQHRRLRQDVPTNHLVGRAQRDPLAQIMERSSGVLQMAAMAVAGRTRGKFDKWAVNGVSADVACCVCGGGSTISGKQACQGHSYDKNACAAVGCCYWNILLGCRANDADEMCYSENPCGTTEAPGPAPGPGHHHGAVIGGVIAGATALAVAGAIAARGSTTAGPGPSTTASAQTTQGAQTTAPTAVTTTTENSSSSLLWLWILLGILALCCLLALCGGGLAAMMGGKKKKKKSKRATRVSQPAPVPVVQPIIEEQQELLPMVPPLLEPMAEIGRAHV